MGGQGGIRGLKTFQQHRTGQAPRHQLAGTAQKATQAQKALMIVRSTSPYTLKPETYEVPPGSELIIEAAKSGFSSTFCFERSSYAADKTKPKSSEAWQSGADEPGVIGAWRRRDWRRVPRGACRGGTLRPSACCAVGRHGVVPPRQTDPRSVSFPCAALPTGKQPRFTPPCRASVARCRDCWREGERELLLSHLRCVKPLLGW